MYKINVFVPDGYITEIIEVMAQAGAGKMGTYTHTAFIAKGEGNWLAGPGSNPTIGKVGEMTRVTEYKLEMLCAENDLAQVVAAIRQAHPYEEPGIDVVKLIDIA
jgi:hypothetical protein